jgi:phenylacetate-CoA ligase
MELMPRSRLERLRLKRLKAALAAAHKIPFYHESFSRSGLTPSDLKKVDDIEKFPFMTKDDLRVNYPFRLVGVPLDDIVEVHATSGTTGVPTLGLHTKKDLEMWGEVSARALAMSGLTRDDVFQITPSFGLFTGGFGFYHGARKIGTTIVPTGGGFSQRQIQLMRDFGTTMISAIVSYALRLAEVALELGIDPSRDTKVRKGILGSETWTKEMKRRIAEIWDMDVYDIYGSTELCGPGVANDCHLHDGLHFWEDNFLVEVIDPETGDVLEPEEEGELVFTHLSKEALPLVRYRSRDLAYLYDSDSCDCGRTHRRISSIKGRVDDMIKVSGVAVWPSQVETALMKYPELGPEYQVVVTRKDYRDHMRVVVECREILSEDQRGETTKKLGRELLNMLNFTPELEIVPVGFLPRAEVGKAKRIIDERG